MIIIAVLGSLHYVFRIAFMGSLCNLCTELLSQDLSGFVMSVQKCYHVMISLHLSCIWNGCHGIPFNCYLCTDWLS